MPVPPANVYAAPGDPWMIPSQGMAPDPSATQGLNLTFEPGMQPMHMSGMGPQPGSLPHNPAMVGYWGDGNSSQYWNNLVDRELPP